MPLRSVLFSTRFLLFILLLWLRTALTQQRGQRCGYGYKCFPHRVVSAARGFEIRSYDETYWITWQEHGGITDLTDFPFLVEYTDRKLTKYFEKVNYAGEGLNRTTPLKIDVEIFNLHHPRTVSYPVRVDEEDGIPAPFHPLFITKMARRFVYVRQVPSDLPYLELLHAAVEFMADLAYNNEPFDKKLVNLVLYTRPNPRQESDAADANPIWNEIWVTRTINSHGFGYDAAYQGGFGGGGYDGGIGNKYGDDGCSGDIFSDEGSFGRDRLSGGGRFSIGSDGLDGSGHFLKNGGPRVIQHLTKAQERYLEHKRSFRPQ